MQRLMLTALAAMFFTSVAHAAEIPGIYGGAEVPTFDEFPALQCKTTTLAEPHFVPATEAWHYREVIRKGAKYTGVNFDCAFTIITWDCISACSIVVDRTDGKTYSVPDAWLSDYSFLPGSSLLVTNTHADRSSVEELRDLPRLWRTFYEFKNGRFVFLYRDMGEKNVDVLDTPHPVSPEMLQEMEQNNTVKK